MRFSKLAVPVLASLALAASAVAIADDPSGDGSGDSTVTVCVVGSDNALGSTCVIATDGDPLAGGFIAPGDNYIVVPDTGGDLTVAGDEVLGKSILEEEAGLN